MNVYQHNTFLESFEKGFSTAITYFQLLPFLHEADHHLQNGLLIQKYLPTYPAMTTYRDERNLTGE